MECNNPSFDSPKKTKLERMIKAEVTEPKSTKTKTKKNITKGWSLQGIINLEKVRVKGISHEVSKPFDLIHCDIWGAYFVKSFCGASYFLTILDDANPCIWVYLMKCKSAASQLVRDFCAMVQT